MRLRDSLVCLSLLGVLSVPVRAAYACGPDFPVQLLDNRAVTLSELPDSTFLFEARRLVPKPADAFLVVEGPEPEGVRKGGGSRERTLYEAGARLFHETRPDEAAARFREVLALPESERRHFSTLAAYMLGRTASPPEATERFAEVRALARQGFADPLGLAVASLGEEAREHLLLGADVKAVQLYAQQAAHGSASGATSLLFMARLLVRDEARLKRALPDPLVQRLLATYAWTRGHEEAWTEDGSAAPLPLARLVDLLAEVPGLAGADRLAVTAWREGRFELAERFAGQERTPLDAWVRAKLALRRGDRTQADQCLAEAGNGYPAAEDWQTDPYLKPLRPRMYVEAERSLLALLRDDFPGAAEHALSSCSWPDIAYVTERVLSVDELRRFLAAHAADPRLRCQPDPAFYVEEGEPRPTVEDSLRPLVGRRLLRDGHGVEALEFFRGTPWEVPARHYVDAFTRAHAAWTDDDEARSLYAAARLARFDGMELLGTETAPDWHWVAGEFDMDVLAEEFADQRIDRPLALAHLPLMSAQEKHRREAHAPKYLKRFQYRLTAADLAEQAAQLMPPRSQAYAALLCQSARFSMKVEPERAQRLWETYVLHGALLPDATDFVFGQSCPAPDFERRLHKSRAHPVRKRTLAALGGGLLVLGVGLTLWRRAGRRPGSP
ncbi:hypothetical protein [Archangium primigenium]|uniref:hypothetical protein n=1 Tax=[Archangium] primigenium TaxID=2792470 RepID=UPI00195908C4|nr:hypothetical protein [Archangium primigenium]MBM7116058.1 hypothetical protein [Archangium primigenium]